MGQHDPLGPIGQADPSQDPRSAMRDTGLAEIVAVDVNRWRGIGSEHALLQPYAVPLSGPGVIVTRAKIDTFNVADAEFATSGRPGCHVIRWSEQWTYGTGVPAIETDTTQRSDVSHLARRSGGAYLTRLAHPPGPGHACY